MEIKKPLTYEEQVERLKNYHNLQIEDEEKAISILKTVNYYRLSGYGIGLKQLDNNELYTNDISLELLFRLYCFDSQLKNNLIKTIEQIEIQLRTQIAYHLAIKYGSLGYMQSTNFILRINKDGKEIHKILIDDLIKEISRQKNVPFVKHHIENYNSNFPIWVAVELMTFGNLSSWYSIMNTDDQKAISNLYDTEPAYLKNWILCLVEVGNICAHYNRLYNMPLKQTPKLYKENEKFKDKLNKIFPILLIIKRMLKSNDQWISLLNDIGQTLKKYEGCYKLEYMGFPDNWVEILKL